MPITIWTPNEKSTHNPLYSSELRNKPCICGSGKKVKKCHGRDPFILKETMDALEDLVQSIQKLNDELEKGDTNDKRERDDSGRGPEESGAGASGEA
jgi:hypothetical protein